LNVTPLEAAPHFVLLNSLDLAGNMATIYTLEAGNIFLYLCTILCVVVLITSDVLAYVLADITINKGYTIITNIFISYYFW
jgi:hypothetical protein